MRNEKPPLPYCNICKINQCPPHLPFMMLSRTATRALRTRSRESGATALEQAVSVWRSSSSVDLLSRSKSGAERAHGVVVSAAKEMKGALVGPKTQETVWQLKRRRGGGQQVVATHPQRKGSRRRPAPSPAPSVG